MCERDDRRSTGTGLKAGVLPSHSCARTHNSPVPGMSTFHYPYLSLSLCLTYFTISLPSILLTSNYTPNLSLVLSPFLPLASCFYLALFPRLPKERHPTSYASPFFLRFPPVPTLPKPQQMSWGPTVGFSTPIRSPSTIIVLIGQRCFVNLFSSEQEDRIVT